MIGLVWDAYLASSDGFQVGSEVLIKEAVSY